MTHSNRKRAASGRIARRAIFAACLLGALQSPLLADAQTDGERGIEAYQQGRLIEAMELLESAAQGGYAPAQVMLAFIQDAAENDNEAFEWYRRAAEAGDAAGIYGLGIMYAKGEGVERDPVEAGRLIRPRAKASSAIRSRREG
jgi:TPR repeat protein